MVGDGAKLLDCYNEGTVESTGWMVGGLVGSVRTQGIVRGYNVGNVEGSEDTLIIGGLVGGSSGFVIGYNLGKLTGVNAMGGLVGLQMGDKDYLTGYTIGYSTGHFWDGFQGVNTENRGFVGGLVGNSDPYGLVVGYVTAIQFSNHNDLIGGLKPLIGKASGTEKPDIHAYWDKKRFSTDTTVPSSDSINGAQQGISSIANVKWDGTSYYDDVNQDGVKADDGSEPQVFDAMLFMQYFEVQATSPGDGKWPHLKEEYFSMTQPDIWY